MDFYHGLNVRCHPPKRGRRQTGGTLLGLIIGVVAGLAMALAVAVYVTKVPIPFLNKGQSRTLDQDAAEAKKNKDWDPNAPLYGKNPAKPQVAASAPAGAASGPAPATAVTPPATTVAKPEIVRPDSAKPDTTKPDTAKPESAKPASADPLGDLARAKSSGSVVDPFTYFVQAGAYRTAEDAESQRVKLSLSGLEAKVTEREQSGRAIFRVRVGPIDKKEDADKTKEKLEAAGFDTALVRVQR